MNIFNPATLPPTPTPFILIQEEDVTTDALLQYKPKSYGNIEVAVTHDGAFHADELMGLALVLHTCIQSSGTLMVMRTRNPDLIAAAQKNPDIWVIDVGMQHKPDFSCYDHHQDANLPSAFGLLFAELKGNIEEFNALEDDDTRHYAIERFCKFVTAIDDWDCNRNAAHGIAATLPDGWRNTSQIISGFNRLGADKETEYKAFIAALDLALHLLKNEINAAVAAAKAEIAYTRRQIVGNNVAVFEQFSPIWREKGHHAFAIMPTAKGEWQLLAADSKKAALPETIAHSNGCSFYHAGRFIAIFSEKQQAIAAAENNL